MVEAAKNTKLSDHACSVIDEWLKKYPPDQKRSAVLAALREVQHENNGYLTTELIVLFHAGIPTLRPPQYFSLYKHFLHVMRSV